MKIRGIAHRGYPVKYPENTLVAYQAAYELDFTHLELEFHLSKDGIPVLMHDYTIDKMTNGKGFIRDYTLEELKQFRVKGAEQIPTLEEALNLLKWKMDILIELKQAGDLYPGLEEKVLEIVRRTDTLEHSRIISFDHFSLIRTRQLNPDIRLGALCTGSLPYVFPFLKEIDCDFLGIHFRFVTPRYAEMIAENGVISGPWPIETIQEMEIIAAQYPTALITTNHLERWADFYRNHSELHL
ncbi:glycerophosphodiester phosphodiesterase [Paenibacillus sp. UNC451MF]|uniref:glycerophosphodiester phosphodiesterase n=1 Tax=Paenibacillus sp. UNC451MF TaxID=1449063 RepID=UPI0004912A2C|nr:glycerophosphodiester phosphodiesterase family protein [Paenibacillus sp. UNC451MF]